MNLILSVNGDERHNAQIGSAGWRMWFVSTRQNRQLQTRSNARLSLSELFIVGRIYNTRRSRKIYFRNFK